MFSILKRVINLLILIIIILMGGYYYFDNHFINTKEYNEDIIKEAVKEINEDDLIQLEKEINQEKQPNKEIETKDEVVFSNNQYYKTFLNEAERKVYYSIINNSLKHNATFNVSGIKESNLHRIYRAFLNDNPEHFWIDNIKYFYNPKNNMISKIELLFSITMNERLERQTAIDNVVNDILNNVNHYDSHYDKIKYINNYIVNNTTYDLKAPDNQNIYSVFVNRRSVCAGYARSFQYLMNKLGIHSIFVTGKALQQDGEEVGHAWNLVEINNEYYNIDVTWSNSNFITGEENNNNYINYHYFNITDEEILTTHLFDSLFSVPESTAVTYNYYVVENLFFNNYNNSTKTRLINDFIAKSNFKEKVVSFKFSNRDAYDNAIKQLFERGDLFYIVREVNKRISNKIDNSNLKYYLSENKLIIDIIFNYK